MATESLAKNFGAMEISKNLSANDEETLSQDLAASRISLN